MSIRAAWLGLLLLTTLSFARPAQANSIPVSVSYSFTINNGSGDNAASSFTGPGTAFVGGGSTGCAWCFFGTTFSPGQSLNASVYYLDFGSFFTGQFQGTIIDPSNFSLGITSMTAGSFTFPSFGNASTFTVIVPASMGFVNGQAGGQLFTLQIMPGQLVLNFSFLPAGGGIPAGYNFNNAQYVTTPEPETVVLLGSGLLLIAATSFHRKFRERV